MLGLQSAIHNAQQGRRGLFVSLEMKDRELALRYVCQNADVDSINLRKGTLTTDELDEMQRVADAANLPLRLYAPERHATFADIKGAVRHAQMVHGIEAVYVDYIGRIRPMKDERHLKRNEQVGEWIIGFKSLAKELDIPVVVIAQLNRDSDKEKPHMAHLAESSDLEREADMILFLHHPLPETPADKQAWAKSPVKKAVVTIGKHRHGLTGDVVVGWKPSRTLFIDEQPAELCKSYNGSFASYIEEDFQ